MGFLSYLITIILLGLFVGSFLNVIIYRLPIMLQNKNWETALEILGHAWPSGPTFNLVQPFSFCSHCFKPLRYWEKIPILSYLFLWGKAACCEKKISRRYPLVEILSSVLTMILALHFGLSITFFFSFIFTASLITLFFIDIETLLLPDQITLPLLWLGFFANIQACFTTLSDAVYGAIFGYMFCYIITFLLLKLRKLEGLGRGDFKLIAALGAWFGWKSLVTILFLSSIIGLIFGIIYIYLKKTTFTSPLPFGPFLSLSGFFVLLYQPHILHLKQFSHF